MKSWIAILCTALIVVSAGLRADAFCPGCVPTVNETRAEIVARCDLVVLAQWKSARAVTEQDAAYTEFTITLVGKDREFIPSAEPKPVDVSDKPTTIETPTESPNPPDQPVAAVQTLPSVFKAGQTIRLSQFLEAAEGDLFFLTGTRTSTGTVDWEVPVEITETAYHYIMQAPSPEVMQTERLRYYLKFLESSNALIANDAYNEFALAAFEDVVPLQDELPVDNLRKWLTDDATTQTHLGLYGILLGLGGERADAEILKNSFADKRNEYSLGIEGAITGYLFLTGADGVQMLERDVLSNEQADVDQVYPVIRGLEIVWTYGADRVPRQRLIEAMRMTLSRPRLREFSIITLTRWKDWESLDRIKSIFQETSVDEASVRRSIVMFMLTCSRATHDVDGKPEPVPQAQAALAIVEQIRQTEPNILESVERMLSPIPKRPPARKTDG